MEEHTDARLPAIIQGGMGVAVSNWRLARAVSLSGQLGVVSGTGIDAVIVRRLQDGDIGGHVRRALSHFPLPQLADEVLRRYFKPGGRQPGEPYKGVPMHTGLGTVFAKRLIALANFVEVFLAKEGHSNPVGLNLLSKVQTHTLPSLYGAMLGGVDYVLMGAGIPREIPGALDRFAADEPASIKLDVAGLAAGETSPSLTLHPAEILGDERPALKRPRFLPIIASNLLATIMAKKANGRVDGFIIEGPTAGGHNAPPRGTATFDEYGQPVYGEKDVVKLDAIREMGLPFWLAGGSGSPEALQNALAAGAAGIQVGTLFSLCEESGFADHYKDEIIERAVSGEAVVRTDARASPTGFPFKVVDAPGSLALAGVYEQRERVCDLGYLREPYKREDGQLGFRCAAEPEETFLAKGGDAAETPGRKCLCNALLSAAGLPQVRKSGVEEKPLFTSGDDLVNLRRFLGEQARRYGANEVIEYLLGRRPTLA